MIEDWFGRKQKKSHLTRSIISTEVLIEN